MTVNQLKMGKSWDCGAPKYGCHVCVHCSSKNSNFHLSLCFSYGRVMICLYFLMHALRLHLIISMWVSNVTIWKLEWSIWPFWKVSWQYANFWVYTQGHPLIILFNAKWGGPIDPFLNLKKRCLKNVTSFWSGGVPNVHRRLICH